ncbi:unnamed protein product [Ectocarpus sp. 12 AP-2014]
MSRAFFDEQVSSEHFLLSIPIPPRSPAGIQKTNPLRPREVGVRATRHKGRKVNSTVVHAVVVRLASSYRPGMGHAGGEPNCGRDRRQRGGGRGGGQRRKLAAQEREEPSITRRASRPTLASHANHVASPLAVDAVAFLVPM